MCICLSSYIQFKDKVRGSLWLVYFFNLFFYVYLDIFSLGFSAKFRLKDACIEAYCAFYFFDNLFFSYHQTERSDFISTYLCDSEYSLDVSIRDNNTIWLTCLKISSLKAQEKFNIYT